MEPKFEQPKQYTPEEIAEMEKSRTISDAELLKGGAEYAVDEKGEKENLLATEKQKSSNVEFFLDEEERIRQSHLMETLRQNFKSGDKVRIKLAPSIDREKIPYFGVIKPSVAAIEDTDFFLVGDPVHGDVLQVTMTNPSKWSDGSFKNQGWRKGYVDFDLLDILDVKKVEN